MRSIAFAPLLLIIACKPADRADVADAAPAAPAAPVVSAAPSAAAASPSASAAPASSAPAQGFATYTDTKGRYALDYPTTTARRVNGDDVVFEGGGLKITITPSTDKTPLATRRTQALAAFPGATPVTTSTDHGFTMRVDTPNKLTVARYELAKTGWIHVWAESTRPAQRAGAEHVVSTFKVDPGA